MKKHSFLLTTLFILSGAATGLLLGWLLPAVGSANLEPAATQTPVVLIPQSTEEVWPLPTFSDNTDNASSPRVLKAGVSAPDFTLTGFDGSSVQLSNLRGSVVVLNFWASWCQPCRQEMPDLQKLSQQYSEEELMVLGINTTYIDSRQNAQEFVNELGLSFPILLDESGAVGGDIYSVIGLPTSFWIDQDGVIRQINVGAMTWDQMSASAEFLLPLKAN